ncbi:hypothetical protein GBA52_020133 [Prunus armeniaca]|nr:hypothetical protein GBA52_020133 [Prunus armeniaca]
MCFNLGYKFNKQKDDGRNGEEESKGLLLKEMDRWKQKQEEMHNQGDATVQLSNPPTSSR